MLSLLIFSFESTAGEVMDNHDNGHYNSFDLYLKENKLNPYKLNAENEKYFFITW